MSRFRGVAAVIVLALLSGGCSAVAEGSEEAGPLVVALFDVSGSTDSDEIRAGYLEAFGRVLDVVDERDGTVIADVIDENPLAHSTYPVSATFEACDALTDNRLTCDAEARQTRDEAVATVRRILESEVRPAGTDIHNGLRLAERVFDAYPEADERYLVVFSDMVERSSSLNLGRPSLDVARVGSMLDELSARDQIPDLAGVSVYAVGAGVVAGPELSGDRILAIERFWQGFFQRSGAEWSPERYGAALVRFP
jgi:hypothetical protein